MKSKAYWRRELLLIAKNQYHNSNTIVKRLAKQYKASFKELDYQLAKLYVQVLGDGEVSATTLFKEDRYIKLKKAIIAEVNKLGGIEEKAIADGLKTMYTGTIKQTNKLLGISFTNIPAKQVDKAIRTNWAGRNFADSVWDNKKLLAKTLDKTITDSIISGNSHDKTSAKLAQRCDVETWKAERLVRTETMNCINQGQKESYIDAGCTQYEFLAEIDDRTSAECEALNREIFNLGDAVTGDNYPPLHPNCRCTTLPVID